MMKRTDPSDQLALFAVTDSPAGLRYAPEFITPAAERELIDHIRGLDLEPFQFGAFEGKRRVASFGWRYDYNTQRLQSARAAPDWLLPVIKRIESWAELPPGAVVQVLCTEYDVGVVIGWHRDKPHFGDVFGLSLASSCRFRFRRKLGSRWQRYTLEAAPRSLYQLSGEARRIWEHSIPGVPAPRYSITFRTMARLSKSGVSS
jgi:alkylated DNA repair dioxygenase AlkB